jgi:hypothetical protein
MQVIGSSGCSLLPKVEGMNHLVSKLVEVGAQDKSLLDECVDLFSYNRRNGGRGIQLESTFNSTKTRRFWDS